MHPASGNSAVAGCMEWDHEERAVNYTAMLTVIALLLWL